MGTKDVINEINLVRTDVNKVLPLASVANADGGRLNVPGKVLTLGTTDHLVLTDWLRILSNPADGNSYSKGIAVSRLWARDDLTINGNSANAVFNLGGQKIVSYHDDGWVRIVNDPASRTSYGYGLAVRKLYTFEDLTVSGRILALADQRFVVGTDDWIRVITNPADVNSYGKGIMAKQFYARDFFQVTQTGYIQLGSQFFKEGGGGDPWIRILSDPNNGGAYSKGLAAAQFWARDRIHASGRDLLSDIDNNRVAITNDLNAHKNWAWNEINALKNEVNYLKTATFRRVTGNNGGMRCAVYCACNWNGELPGDWNGAACVGTIPPQAGCDKYNGVGNWITCVCQRTNLGWLGSGHCYPSE